MNLLPIGCFVLLASLSAAQTTTEKPCPDKDSCLSDLAQAKISKSISAFCTALSKSGNCFRALTKSCPAAIKKTAEEAQIHLDNQEMQDGCTGPCGEAADKCVSTLAAMVKGNTTYNLKLCKTITKSFDCLEALNATTCTKESKNLLKYFSKSTKDEEFSGLCDDSGNVTPCFKKLDECMANIQDVNNKTPVKKSCLAMEKFLQCQAGDGGCKDTLKKYKSKVVSKMETEETKVHCATEGTCNDRVVKCANPVLTALGHTANPDKHVDKICNDVKAALKCFDFVRKDPVCVVDASEITDDEKKIRSLADSKCDTASSVVVSSALIGMGVVLSVMKNYL